MSYIYLACPYSHHDPDVRMARVLAADQAAGILMDKGHIVYSPISHGARAAEFMKTDPCSQRFWLRQCWPFLIGANGVHVLTLPGWTFSKGVRLEVEAAWAIGIPVCTISPQDYEPKLLPPKEWVLTRMFQGA